MTPSIDRTYPLDQVPDAMRHLEAGNVRGKVAITIPTDTKDAHDHADQMQASSDHRTMSRRTIAVVVGILFFVQMLTAMFGTSMIQAFVDGDTEARPTVGVLLMMCSGLAVVGIGLLMYQVLKDVNQRLAFWYPVLRIVEFTVSAACGVYLLTQLQVVPNHLLWVYIPTGIGGLILTYLLLRLTAGASAHRRARSRRVCHVLAGSAARPPRRPEHERGSGHARPAPGGLFEFVFMPIWLIAKGFAAPLNAGHLGDCVSGWLVAHSD